MRNVWGEGLYVLWYCLSGALSLNPLNFKELTIHRTEGNSKLDKTIVFPRRVNEFEEILPSHRHFHKRSVRENWDKNADYLLEINGENIKFSLEHTNEFVIPGVQVQHYSENLTWLQESNVDTGLSCYYHGTLNGTRGSHVSLSLCDGMTGMFSLDGKNFLIEPYTAEDNASLYYNHSNSATPHLLYSLKHSHLKNTSEPACSYTENYKHKRRKRDPQSDIGNLYSSDSRINNNIINNNNLISSSLLTNDHHRSKRSVSYKNYVEVMVAADSQMVKYHGDNLQHYILNLMSIVNSMYKDHTINNFIHIVVVKLIIFHTDREGPRITDNAGETLKRFCKWQSKNNEDESSRYHYDTAILLTRHDICRAPKRCDTLGLAELGTMCDPDRSCSIIEDNGISAAYTIAHELGHVFDLPHDDDDRCRRSRYNRDPKAKTYIMSPAIGEYTDPWSWSDCSSNHITKFLDAGYGNCLHDVPKMKKYRRHIKRAQKKQVGSMYNADKQCELVYGKGYIHCPFLQSCHILWCTKNLNDGCRTQHMPMADGTKCGNGKWCMRGQCSKAKNEKKVKGGWGKWKPYGKCTRTCGGGIKKALRECDNPAPKAGGRYCSGKRIKYRHCNTKPCLINNEDFRIQQCAEYNSQMRYYNISTGSRWIPKYKGIPEKDWCKLWCMADSSPSHFYMLNHKVIDGTKCRPDADDICVNGLCRRGGCDNKLGSDMKRDRCGVCGGDNASCKTISGTYNRVQYGYNNVTVIPIGATNIDIRQHGYRQLKDDENYLAVVNSRNEYLLNGGFTINLFPQKMEVKGAVLEYSGSETYQERINSTGMLGENIHLQILSVGNLNPPNIQYSYTMSLTVTDDEQFVWKEDTEWTECNDICNGMRYRKVKCVNENDYSPVSEQRCENQPKPYTERERCNPLCTVNWRVNRDECSAHCGTGVAKQYISCTLTTRKNTTNIDISHCHKRTSEIGPKPQERVVCYGKCVETHWKYSDWTECTASCQGGVQKRSAKCEDTRGNEVSSNHCSVSERVLERTCNNQPCPVWKNQDWTGCSVTCGHGTRHRKVTCYLEDKEVIETKCNYKIRPGNKLECYMGTCPRWISGEWGECSTSCEMGIAIRSVQCEAVSGQFLDDFHCDATLRPFETKHCNLGVCPTTTSRTTTEKSPHTPAPIKFEWTTGSWTQCSTSCGEGSKQRYVTCMTNRGDVADPYDCDQLSKPIETDVCVQRACGYWRTGDWSECSVSCGEGIQTRVTACTLMDRRPATDGQCDTIAKPEDKRPCDMEPCKSEDYDIGVIITNTVVGISHWRVGPWSACSATCGTGWQRRQVLCHDEKGPSDSCADTQKPDTRQSCDAGACPRWVKGEWTQCSRSCGEMGIQKRTVQCQNADGQKLPDTSCDIFKRPTESGMCNNGPCSKNRLWQVGPWSSCSVTCGTGRSQREVLCVSEAGLTRPSSECDNPKPRNTKRCTLHNCPQWIPTRWGKCSTTCGSGVQRREITCHMTHGDVIPDHLCLGAKRPRTERKCTDGPCSEYMWNIGNWTECSKDCGFGRKTRDVNCTDINNNIVDSDLCDASKKPKPKRRCSEFPCPFMWNTSPWSECSTSCASGVQVRRAVCQAVTREGWILPGEVPYGCKTSEKPSESQTCNYGPCQARYRWLVAPWGECSTRCGHGYERRQVQCVDFSGQRKKKKFCSKPHRPKARQDCYNGPCYASSCVQLREQTSIRQDGSYKLFLQGRLIEIYCKNMKRAIPEEFLSLPDSETDNYAEIYPYRLKRHRTCPNNGTRQDPCTSELCRDRRYRNTGKTSYSKIKLDIVNLKVQVADLTFASSVNGKHIPFGSAGDCYSSAECPQGRFNINLSGTGLIVSPNTTWVSQGTDASQRIDRLQEGEVIQGWCGGLCGWCSSETGIQLEVLS